jgi:hypothetical protein
VTGDFVAAADDFATDDFAASAVDFGAEAFAAMPDGARRGFAFFFDALDLAFNGDFFMRSEPHSSTVDAESPATWWGSPQAQKLMPFRTFPRERA